MEQPSPATEGTQTLAVAKEQETIERRRRLVAQWRLTLGATLPNIRERLKAVGIETSKATICRDLQTVRRELKRRFNERGFDAHVEVGVMIARYEFSINRMMRDAAATKDIKERALCVKVMIDAQKALSDLLQDCELVTARRFLIPVEDDGKKVERISTGEENQRYFDSINVTDGEIISDAERALLYGDQAAADAEAPGDHGRSTSGAQGEDLPD